MVKSMTGYGRAREMRSGRDITVEVRSVNNRYLDCTVKLPRAYIFAEDAIKTRVQKAISRGKVDVFVTIDTSAADVAVVQVNEGLAKGYYDALMHLKNSFALPGDVTPEVLARFPDVLTVTKAEEDVEAIAADICAVLDDALAAYNAMRAVEGEKLALDVSSRVDTIEETVSKVEAQSPQTVAAYRQRLEAKMRRYCSPPPSTRAVSLPRRLSSLIRWLWTKKRCACEAISPSCGTCCKAASPWAESWIS